MHSCTHTDVVNETHHHIVSLHLSFLTGQFLTLQFQTVRQKENVILLNDINEHTAIYTFESKTKKHVKIIYFNCDSLQDTVHVSSHETNAQNTTSNQRCHLQNTEQA